MFVTTDVRAMGGLNVSLNRWGICDLNSIPPLGSREVHVWQVDLDNPGQSLCSLHSLLDADETARCSRLYADTLQHRFSVRRGVLRLLLSHYTGLAPQEIDYRYGEQGKPELAAHQAAGIFFNVSDAQNHAVIAFTRVGEIGIDIELALPFDNMLGVARGYFSQSERAQLAALPADARTVGFYACWTRKEAVIKCIGSGLAMSLDSFSVSLLPGHHAAILEAKDSRVESLILRDLALPVPLAAAFAVEPPPLLR